jgi:hypothetical protein
MALQMALFNRMRCLVGSIRKHGHYWRISYYRDGKRVFENTYKQHRFEAEEILAQREEGIGASRRSPSQPVAPGIYFLRSRTTGLVKIGMSRNLPKRIEGLKRILPDKIDVLALLPAADCAGAENSIHRFLSDNRSHGEWFRATGEDIEAAIRHWVLEVAAL